MPHNLCAHTPRRILLKVFLDKALVCAYTSLDVDSYGWLHATEEFTTSSRLGSIRFASSGSFEIFQTSMIASSMRASYD